MILRALVCFILVFGVGFVLGTIRVLWLAPSLGERAAELAEMPLMLGAIVGAAFFVVRRFPSSDRSGHLVSGLLALGLMIVVESGFVLSLRDLRLREYLAERDQISGTVYVGSLIVFALMPWWIAPRAASSTVDPASQRDRR